MATTRRSPHTSPPKTVRPKCPHCGQLMPQPRTESLTPRLARALEFIAQAGGLVGFIDVPAHAVSAASHGRLKYWGVLEAEGHVQQEGSRQTRSGRWRVTDLGRAWIEGRVRLPLAVQVLQDRRVDEGSGMLVSFNDVLALDQRQHGKQKLIEDDAEREWLRERARLERSYLEEED